MDLSLAQQAIDAALAGDWNAAEKANNAILLHEPDNKGALNRLGRAYAELGKLTKALTCYKKVLKRDPYNSIAQKAIEKLERIEKKPQQSKNGINNTTPASIANVFLEEPGKTKTVPLLHLGDKSVISLLDSGDEVKLLLQNHKASVHDNVDNKYIGRLPDDIAIRLIKLSRAGNKYIAHTRSVKADEVKIFIREIGRADSLEGIPSFPAEKTSYISFTPPELIHHEKPNARTSENDY